MANDGRCRTGDRSTKFVRGLYPVAMVDEQNAVEMVGHDYKLIQFCMRIVVRYILSVQYYFISRIG